MFLLLQVHLGHGFHIEEEVWERLVNLPTNSTFCKQLAVRMWGNDTLKDRTLTGTLSNQAIAKGTAKKHTPLTPIKVASLSGEESLVFVQNLISFDKDSNKKKE